MFRKLWSRAVAGRALKPGKAATAKSESTNSANPFRAGSYVLQPNIGAVGYGLLAVPVTTFALGCWQVQRRQWKLDLIEKMEQLTQADPIALPADLRELNDLEYRRVRVRGQFIHEDELYIGPRTDVHKEKSGFLVVTPFKLEDSDMTILVNRGWVARNKINPATRPEGQASGPVELVGIVRKTEKRPPLGAKDSRVGPLFSYRDIGEMAYAVGAAPVFLDAIRESSVKGGPSGGQTRVQLRNEHASYIATWYTLTACTLYLWYVRYGKLLKK